MLLSFICIIFTSCGPPAIQPWFLETIEIGEYELPDGIILEVIREEYRMGFQDHISISNSTNDPVFIPVVSKWDNDTSLAEVEEPCPHNNHCIKVVSNQAWEWIEQVSEREKTGDYDWLPANKYSNSDQLILDLFCGGVKSSNYIIQEIECKNEYDYGFGRPKYVEPPEPQIFYLLYIFDGNEESIGVTIYYSINENYERDFSFEATGLLSICSGPSVVLIALALLASAVLVFKYFGKMK